MTIWSPVSAHICLPWDFLSTSICWCGPCKLMPRSSDNIFASQDENQLVIALAKGKLLAPSLQRLASAGFDFADADMSSRRLILSMQTGGLHALLVKPQDVPIYVEYGIADIGIVGKDILLESE